MIRVALPLLAASLALAVALPGIAMPGSSDAARFADAADAREALEAARQQQRNARARAERLERQSVRSEATAEKAQADAAALAARVQQSEAAITAAEAELALVEGQRLALDRQLARKREPLMRLTAALQTMSRRPLALAALQPGSLEDVVHTRAALASAMPVVRERTRALRSDLDRARALEKSRADTLGSLRSAQASLTSRRKELVALAEKERVLARRAAGGASREAERALVLSEEARDLDALVGELELAGALRVRLAALPGPVLRPEEGKAAASQPVAVPSPDSTEAPSRYLLPVAGRVVAGFGEASVAGSRTSGIAIAPRPRAQIVSPGAGRVAFAGPYRGFGSIVIVEHDNGWTSLVTGLGNVSVEVGQQVTAGSPLGQAPLRRPEVALELRREGEPVNPLDHLR